MSESDITAKEHLEKALEYTKKLILTMTDKNNNESASDVKPDGSDNDGFEGIPDEEEFIDTVRDTVADEPGEGKRLESIESSIPTEGGKDNKIFNAALAEEVIELHGLECMDCGLKGSLDSGCFVERENAMGNTRQWSGSHLLFYLKCSKCESEGQIGIEPYSYDDYEGSIYFYDTNRCRIKLLDAHTAESLGL